MGKPGLRHLLGSRPQKQERLEHQHLRNSSYRLAFPRGGSFQIRDPPTHRPHQGAHWQGPSSRWPSGGGRHGAESPTHQAHLPFTQAQISLAVSSLIKSSYIIHRTNRKHFQLKSKRQLLVHSLPGQTIKVKHTHAAPGDSRPPNGAPKSPNKADTARWLAEQGQPPGEGGLPAP